MTILEAQQLAEKRRAARKAREHLPRCIECGEPHDTRIANGETTCRRCAYGQDAIYLETCATRVRVHNCFRVIERDPREQGKWLKRLCE